MRIIGEARDFWRVRMVHLSLTGDIDAHWHDDILYRDPVMDSPSESESYCVEAVGVSSAGHSVRIATFAVADEARDYLAQVSQDLATMTRAQFEERYQLL